MNLLGQIIIGFILGPVVVVAIFLAMAFPWHLAALVTVAIVIFGFLVFGAYAKAPADRPEPRRDADRAANDLLAPPQ